MSNQAQALVTLHQIPLLQWWEVRLQPAREKEEEEKKEEEALTAKLHLESKIMLAGVCTVV